MSGYRDPSPFSVGKGEVVAVIEGVEEARGKGPPRPTEGKGREEVEGVEAVVDEDGDCVVTIPVWDSH